MDIKFWSKSLSLGFCYLLVNWTGSWILLVLLNIWLWLSKLILPIFIHSSDLESLRSKTSLEPRWKGPYQVIIQMAAKLQGIETWVHIFHLKRAPSTLLELHSNWRSKIKINWGGSSPEADDSLRWTACPRLQIKNFIFNKKSLCLWPFCCLLSLSVNAWEDVP